MNALVRAKRILSPMDNFKANFKGELLTYSSEVTLKEDEQLIGIYENKPNSLTECVVITNKGLHIEQNGEWQWIGYLEIKSIHGPSDKATPKEKANVVVGKMEGKELAIPIRGGKDQFLDAFEFTRFLMRVCEDRKSI